MSLVGRLTRAVEARWYGQPGLLRLLTPLEMLYTSVVSSRRRRLEPVDVGAPVLVVGNLTVGGVGKTPLVIALVKALQASGLRPGVVSRGYGRQDRAATTQVSASSTPEQVGDEPLLIFEQCRCPVVVGTDRVAAAQTLLSTNDCNVVVSDDGLQHYRLHRHVNIVVVDSRRGFGNGRCLPVGPLREPVCAAFKKDFLIQNGHSKVPPPNDVVYERAVRQYWTHAHVSQLQTLGLRNLITGEIRPVSALSDLMPFTAVAAIGHPQRFFLTLKQALARGCAAEDGREKAFASCRYPDHHRFVAKDFIGLAHSAVVMTAKDAVKCRAFAKPDWWCLDVEASLPKAVIEPVLETLADLLAQYAAKPTATQSSTEQ